MSKPFYLEISRRYQQRTYEQFVQRVRRHRPSELLPAIARASVRMADREAWMRGPDRVMTPWLLGLAAKESIVAGNEHRASGVTDRDVLEICYAAAEVRDPLGDGTDTGRVAAFMTRVSHEQFPFQMSPFEEISRTQALFVDELAVARTARLTPAILAEALGAEPTSFAGVGFMLAAGAMQNDGYFDLAWLDQSNFTEILEVIPADLIQSVFHQHFGTTFEDVRSAVRGHRPSGDLRRHEYNPLRGRPFVEMTDGRWLAPQPAYAFQKLEPNSVYYAVAPRLGADFTNDLGLIFENYVGRQLQLLGGAQVIGEIVYDRDQRSVDRTVVFDDVVVLVEAKTTRLTASARLGTSTLAEDLNRTLGEAFQQIERSLSLIRDGHPAFAAVPQDRAFLGLVVTLEPYWNANSDEARSLVASPAPSVPTIVASSREVERWVADHLESGGGATLLRIANDPEVRTWNLELALPDRGNPGRPRNPLLEDAWRHLPWREAAEGRLGEQRS